MKLLPECCSSKCVGNLAAKKWERECSCNQTWAKIQWKLESNVWEGVSEWELSVTAQHPLLGLYLKREWPGTTATSRWKKMAGSRYQVGPADPRVRPAPLWAHWLTARDQGLPNGYKFWNFGFLAKLCFDKMFKFTFQRIFMLGNSFGFFCKKKC